MLLGGDTYLIQIECSFSAAIVYIHTADANANNCKKRVRHKRRSQTLEFIIVVVHSIHRALFLKYTLFSRLNFTNFHFSYSVFKHIIVFVALSAIIYTWFQISSCYINDLIKV